MDIPEVRKILEPALIRLAKTLNHDPLARACADLGLVPPPRNEASPAGRMEAAWKQVQDNDVVAVARRFLERHCQEAQARNDLEDVLYAEVPAPRFHQRLRHELATALEGRPLFRETAPFKALLERLWVLDSHPEELARLSRNTLGNEVERHVFRNDDWGAVQLFEKLGAFRASDRRFCRFLEGMASGDIWRSVEDQQAFTAAVNAVLMPAGLEFRETDSHEGYSVYTLVSRLSGHPSRAKNLIFGSPTKPDLRMPDVISSDIEILSGEDAVLIYDRPISEQGLFWKKDLEPWWAATHTPSDRKALYQRLLESLPKEPNGSPPQRCLFTSYYGGLGPRYPDIPALLPEVWLHWDPKTVKERGFEAMTRFRMDFLLLLPGNRRVVIEVDGKKHYTDKNGRASPKVYAKMVAADRDLRLAGYEVYRFGGAELTAEAGPQLVTTFFEALFRPAGIAPTL